VDYMIEETEYGLFPVESSVTGESR
jgi:hypothetical protein